jgi:signal transduction histidine kinase
MFIDDEQNLWIGMLNGGMSRWRKAPLIPYGKPEGFPAEYAANILSSRNGELWLGTWGKGLFRLRDGQLEAVPIPGVPITMPIRALAQDRRGDIWVGTWFSGIYRYDGKNFQHYLTGIESPGNAVSAIAFDNQGAMWVGTYTGLMRFAGGEPEKWHGQIFLAGQLVTCLRLDSDGTMLAGTSTGLYRIGGERVQPVSGLSHPYVLSISVDRSGNTWVGTKAGGLDLLRGVTAWHISSKDGIPEYPVFSLLDDGRGFDWMGTTRGVVRVPAQQLDALANGQPTEIDSVLLNKSDGMRSSECGGPSQPAAALDKDGSLWFVTARGFVHTASRSSLMEYPPLVARIDGVTLDGEDMDGNGPLELRPGSSELAIHFTAIRLANPGQLEFRYRLVGYDKDWTVTRGRAAHYKRLPPRHYRFEVQVRDEGTTWNTREAGLGVWQRPFFYQTWWFAGLMLAMLCLMTVQFFRWRMVRMKGALGVVVEERNRIAREWHDTLMAGFAAISWQLETTARLFRESGAGAGPAMQSCELARNMVSHCQAEARRIIWDLRDTDEPADRLSLALERTLSTLGSTSEIEKHLEVVGDEVPLAPGSVHQLVRIGQEAVTNALRHADPTSILIRLHYFGNALNLSVRDDGRGFQPSIVYEAMRGHFGIPMMEERARKLGGTLRVESVIGRGTEVIVSVPFQMQALAAGAQA